MRGLALRAALTASLALITAQYVQAQSQPSQSAPKSERIFGYGMMTGAERNEYREKMRSAKTADERQAGRDEQQKNMRARMQERGIAPGSMHPAPPRPAFPKMRCSRARRARHRVRPPPPPCQRRS